MTTAKAWVGSAVAFLGTVATALEDGRLEASEVGVIVAAGVVAYGAVWRVRNKPS